MPQTSLSERRVGAVPGRTESLGAPFYFVLFSLLFEFGRPQDVVPALKVIPFASILDGLIALSLFFRKVDWSAPQTRLWVPLLGLMALHVPIAMNNFHALMTAKDMLQTFCLYLGMVTFIDTFEKLLKVVNVWLGVHVLLAFNGILHEGTGIGGWMGDENDFCMVINMIIPFAFFLMLTSRQPIQKTVYFALLCLFILTSMVTLSRGGFIGLAAVGLYCWYKSAQKFQSAMLVVFVVIFMLLFAPDKYWQEIQSSTDDTTMSVGTGAERLYTWGIAWDIFLGNPILGVGQSNFPWNVEEYEGEQRFNERSLAGRAAHSMYFTLIPELGLVGIVLFALMVKGALGNLRWVERKSIAQGAITQKSSHLDERAVTLARAMSASLIAYFASSIFISTLYYPSVWVMMGFCTTLKNVVVKARMSEDSQDTAPTTVPPGRSRQLWASRSRLAQKWP